MTAFSSGAFGVELSGEIFYLAKTALLLFVINVVMRQQQGGFNSIFSTLSQKSRNATNLSGMLINVIYMTLSV